MMKNPAVTIAVITALLFLFALGGCAASPASSSAASSSPAPRFEEHIPAAMLAE